MDFFKEAVNDPKGLEKKMLGPTYPYAKNIKSPGELGMSDGGDLGTLASDVQGILKYVGVMVDGRSKASATERPLGNKFFLKTGGKCRDVATKKLYDRYVYVNNIPMGNIPILSAATGRNYRRYRGLVPGVMSNMNALNPMGLIGAFAAGSEPDCQYLEMEYVRNNNDRGWQSNHVTISDIKQLDPCDFRWGENPITKKKCNMVGFTNMDGNELSALDNVYILSISGLLMYILYKYMGKV